MARSGDLPFMKHEPFDESLIEHSEPVTAISDWQWKQDPSGDDALRDELWLVYNENNEGQVRAPNWIAAQRMILGHAGI